MVNTFGLNVDIGADEHLSADINFIASQEEASTTNPNYDSETVFVPRMANVKIAATRAALDAATPLCVKNISINFNKKHKVIIHFVEAEVWMILIILILK